MVAEERLSTEDQELEAVLEPAEEPQPGRFAGLAQRLKAKRWFLPGAALVVGLLIGWFVLGWLLWPVRWTNTDLWDLRPEHQERLLSLVAEDYWRTADIRRVRATLDGWDDRALSERLLAMEAREPNPEARQHLVALQEALRLPEMSKPLLASLFGQKTVLFGMVLSALPMAVAVVIAFSSIVKRPATGEQTEEEAEEGEEGELSEDELEQAAVLAAQAGTAEAEGQKPEEEQKKTEQAAAPEATEGGEGEVADILTNLFDDDNEGLERLQALSKGLEDLDIDSLLQRARDVVSQLVRIHALRSQAA
jgi:predicted  nucleic acid-binding Zn-ribbon protein